MERLLLKYLFSLMLAGFVFTACQQEEASASEDTAGATLTMNFSLPATESDSRGLTDLNDDGTTTDEEKNMDGSRLFSLAVFIIDSENVILKTVETDDVTFSSNNTQATVTLTNLNYGETYQLLAIANYGEDAHYQLASNANDLLNGTVTTSATGNLCKNGKPYPLTLKKEIVLQPGNNTISGELTRTFARLRITVRNQSSTNDLQIKSLTFPEDFTFHTANLFETGGSNLSQPDVTHTSAVKSFQPLTIGKNTGDVLEETIFDTYLLESAGGSYTYTLNVSYGTSNVISAGTSIYTTNALNNADPENTQFLIQVYNGGYLYADDPRIKVGTTKQETALQDDAYWWTLEQKSNNVYFIKSASNGKYINSDSESVTLVNNPSTNSDYFTFSDRNSGGMYIKLYYRYYVDYYLWNNDGSIIGNYYSNWGGNRTAFVFHPITSSSQAMEHTEEIPISVIDAETGIASPITSINRNDLINILVNVSYSEDLGEFIFEVTDWNTGGGNVEFD